LLYSYTLAKQFLKQESDLWSDRLLFDLTFGRQFFFVQFQLGARLENNLPVAIVLQRAANFWPIFGSRAQRASFFAKKIMPFHEPAAAASQFLVQKCKIVGSSCLFKREEFDA
jgi:hypothetical protein